MASRKPRKIVILGGGTAGWTLAASLTKVFNSRQTSVRLIESGDIAIVGVGESTLPQVRDFNQFLGLDEVEFMRETNGTFKLAIEFRDWARKGDVYFHPFGTHGHPIEGVPFFQCWLRARANGQEFNIDDFSYPSVASREQKFEFPSEDLTSIRSTYSYAYHFDAYLYAAYLRRWSEARPETYRRHGGRRHPASRRRLYKVVDAGERRSRRRRHLHRLLGLQGRADRRSPEGRLGRLGGVAAVRPGVGRIKRPGQ